MPRRAIREPAGLRMNSDFCILVLSANISRTDCRYLEEMGGVWVAGSHTLGSDPRRGLVIQRKIHV